MIIIDYSLEEVKVTRKDEVYLEGTKSTSEQDIAGIEEAIDNIK